MMRHRKARGNMFIYQEEMSGLKHKHLTKEKRAKCEVTDIYSARPRVVE